MGVDDPREIPAFPLPLSSFGQEILILREEDSAEEGCSIEKVRVLKLMRAILKGGQDIDPRSLRPSQTGRRTL